MHLDHKHIQLQFLLNCLPGIVLLLPLLFEFVFPMLTPGCPQTGHTEVAPEMHCLYTTCDPSRNVKLPLHLPYWLNQQV